MAVRSCSVGDAKRDSARRLAVVLAAAAAALFWVGACPAQTSLYTYSYLLPMEDPACMRLVWQTGTTACDGYVQWGYYGQPLSCTAQASRYHQNILGGEDVVLWAADICAAPGLHIAYHAYAKGIGSSPCTVLYDWSNDFVLPLDPAARHVTFYAYGDTRDCGSDFQRVSHAIREDVLQDSTYPDNLATFLLHSGDAVFNGGQTFTYYKDNYWLEYFNGNFDARHLLQWMPVVLAMGNHDFHWDNHGDYPKYYFMNFAYDQYDKSVGGAPYIDDDGNLVPSDALNDAYYAFDYGPVHVAVLDAYTSGETDNLGGSTIGSGLESGKAQSNWLQSDLAASDKPWKVLMLHVPPISCDASLTDADANSRAFLESEAAAKGVDVVSAGHAHYYPSLSNTDTNLTHLVLGGGGASLDSDCKPPSCGSYVCFNPDFTCNPCAGGYAPDPFHCIGCFFHYAKLHVEHDGSTAVDVWAVHSDGTTEKEDVLFLSQSVPDATAAAFTAPSAPLDYHTPIRFSCATSGAHRGHSWDFGDGTVSYHENPLHAYPKPTDPSGRHTYTVTLTTYAGDSGGGATLTWTQDVTVYVGGELVISAPFQLWTVYAVFLTPQGQTLDEERDYVWSGTGPFEYQDCPPGTYTLTVKALGYDDWGGTVQVAPGKLTYAYANPSQQSHPGATVAIGSVPTGAQVTLTAPDGSRPSGTTPFYAKVCVPDDVSCQSTTFPYVVQNGSVKVEQTGDLSTQNCTPCGVFEGPAEYYVDARQRAEAPTGSRTPLIRRQPSDQRVVKSGSALLRVEAHSRGPVTYRWFEGESGDTSHPIPRATEATYATPRIESEKRYWVRVHGGTERRDSRTAAVTVVGEGPRLTFDKGKKVTPNTWVTIKGRGFEAGENAENRVFFDELEAVVLEAHNRKLTVGVPEGLAGRASAQVRVKARGVWSNPREVRIQLP